MIESEIKAGEIIIQLRGVSEEETFRLREVIHTLISQGSLNIRNGKCIIYFDNDARLRSIEHEFIKWKYQPNLNNRRTE